MNASRQMHLGMHTIQNESTLSNGTWSNSTAVHILSPYWTPLIPAVALVTVVFGMLGNGLLLFVLLRERQLRRVAFNFYIVNLSFVNFSCIAIKETMYFLISLHKPSTSLWNLGQAACTAYIYATVVLNRVLFGSHALIAINRVWAITHPISYRHVHCRRVAILSCAVLWLTVHTLELPGLVIDGLFYRLPVNRTGCHENYGAQPKLVATNNILLFILPYAIILLSFPTILFAQLMRPQYRTKRQPRILPAKQQGVQPVGMALQLIEASRRSTHQPTNDSRWLASNGESVEASLQQADVPRKRRLYRKYAVLTLLTVSVTICWTPGIVLYWLVFFAKAHTFRGIAEMTEVTAILYSCQTMIDPILFTLSLERVRTSLYQLCGWQRSRGAV